MSRLNDTLSNIYYILAIASVFAVVGKLFYDWLRGDQISKRFIVDLAEYHLPHIYRELRHLNPNGKDHPHISFSHFEDKKK